MDVLFSVLYPTMVTYVKPARHPSHFCWGRRAQSSAQRDQAGSVRAAETASTLPAGRQAIIAELDTNVYSITLNPIFGKTPPILHK